MMHLHTLKIDGQDILGYMFTKEFPLEVNWCFFYDKYKNQPGRSDAPRPHMLCLYAGNTYHCRELLPSVDPLFPRVEVKTLTQTPVGKWLQECAITVDMIEFPVWNLSGKESECRYDQKSLSDTEPQVER